MTSIRKIRFIQIFLIILAITLSNCTSSDYDLKNGVNTDLSLGGDSLSFPLGKTKPILLSSMLKDTTGVLKTLADGTYSLQLKDSSQITVNGVNPVTFSIASPYIPSVSSVFIGTETTLSAIKRERVTDYSTQFLQLNKQIKTTNLIPRSNKAITKLNASTNRLNFNIPALTFNIAVSQFVSNDVKKINRLTLRTSAKLVLNIQISNLTVDSLYFNNYTIQLPTFMKFNDPDVNSNNVLTLNSGFLVKDGYTKTLYFDVLDFSSEEGGGVTLNSGSFNLIKQLSMQGKAYIRATNLTSQDIGVFQIQPSLVIGDMPVSLIDGVIKPTIDPISQKIALNLPDALKQTGNVLDVQNPVITLQVGNSMGFLVNAALNITPKSKDGSIIPDGSVSTTFTIPAASILGQSTWTNYWMSKSGTGIPVLDNPYQALTIPTLPNLLRIAPDEVEINITPVIGGDEQHVDLYAAKNQLDVKYTVNVPLDFGKDLKIQYLDTIINLKSNLDQIIKLAKQVELVAFVDNQIPVNLNFEIVPMDVSRKAISGISAIVSDSIKSCNTDGSSQRTNLNLVIKEITDGALKQLDALQIKVSASKNSGIANIPLKPTQSITVELRAKIPKGITITNN